MHLPHTFWLLELFLYCTVHLCSYLKCWFSKPGLLRLLNYEKLNVAQKACSLCNMYVDSADLILSACFLAYRLKVKIAQLIQPTNAWRSSKLTIMWMTVLDWRGDSADLKLNENYGHAWRRLVSCRKRPNKLQQQLIVAIIAAWRHIIKAEHLAALVVRAIHDVRLL